MCFDQGSRELTPSRPSYVTDVTINLDDGTFVGLVSTFACLTRVLTSY